MRHTSSTGTTKVGKSDVWFAPTGRLEWRYDEMMLQALLGVGYSQARGEAVLQGRAGLVERRLRGGVVLLVEPEEHELAGVGLL